ncbi:MAG: IS66 family transposase [Oscillospiraceae bacterium]
MSNWLLRASEDWLEPIYDVLHAQLCRQHVLHADETTLQVLREKTSLRKASPICGFTVPAEMLQSRLSCMITSRTERPRMLRHS